MAPVPGRDNPSRYSTYTGMRQDVFGPRRVAASNDCQGPTPGRQSSVVRPSQARHGRPRSPASTANGCLARHPRARAHDKVNYTTMG
jgi:hypothetical protein